jgi:hypothetical protein
VTWRYWNFGPGFSRSHCGKSHKIDSKGPLLRPVSQRTLIGLSLDTPLEATMVLPLHPVPPAVIALDSAVATAWYAMSVPGTMALRAVGLAKAKPLPTTSLVSKVAIVTGSNTGSEFLCSLSALQRVMSRSAC